MKSIFLAIVNVLLAFASTTLANPCGRLVCGFVEPVCSVPSNPCSCRCNNTAPAQPPPHVVPQAPAPPCGPTAMPSSIRRNRDFAQCIIPTCPCGQKVTCINWKNYGNGCSCKCIKESESCRMPWGYYDCAHYCNRCMCKCVAPAPFKRPSSTCCQPISG
uniref:Putative secreted peptide n=1 Tax=Rhipicephalus pulchellus TaxID=72859 RepID=L7MC26_RHIPC